MESGPNKRGVRHGTGRTTGRFLRVVALSPLVFPGPDDAEADRDLKRGLRGISPATLRTFVVLAVLVQAGLFAGSLGVLLVAFRGQRLVGGALAVVGVSSLAVSAVLYRRRQNRT
jgi:hypothetical protein